MAGLKRINLEGLRWRVFDAKGQVRNFPFYELNLYRNLSTMLSLLYQFNQVFSFSIID